MKTCPCAHCGKIFQAHTTRFRDGNRFKPKYCSSDCYGKARTLNEQERKLRRKERNHDYYLRRKLKGKPLKQTKKEDNVYVRYEESYE